MQYFVQEFGDRGLGIGDLRIGDWGLGIWRFGDWGFTGATMSFLFDVHAHKAGISLSICTGPGTDTTDLTRVQSKHAISPSFCPFPIPSGLSGPVVAVFGVVAVKGVGFVKKGGSGFRDGGCR